MIPITKVLKGEKTVHNERKTGPLFVWNITASCNLTCSHCYRDSRPGCAERELDDAKLISLVSEIKQINPPIVLLTGGEPLLRKNVFDIIKECKSLGLRVGLSTNGTLIDNVMAGKIKEAGIDYVGISVDGNETLHDKFRAKKGAFKASWQAIKTLNALGVKTGVRFTLTAENAGDLMDIFEKTIESGTKRFCLYHLVYAGRAGASGDIRNSERRAVLKEFFEKVKDLTIQDPLFEVLTTDNPADGIFMAGLISKEDAVLSCITSHGGCSAGDRVAYLDSTGELYPCQFLRETSFGNVLDKPLLEIWNDTGNPFLNKMRNMKKHLEGKCGACAHKSICGGCRARAKAYYGSLWAEDPACYLEESEKLSAISFQSSAAVILSEPQASEESSHDSSALRASE